MKRRGWRLLLVLGFVAATMAAAYALWSLDVQVNRQLQIAGVRRAASASAAGALADVRADLQAYVAAGQNVEFWSERIGADLDRLRTSLASLKESGGITHADLDRLLAQAADVSQLERRVREFLAADQTLQASDLVFADGFDMVKAVRDGLDAARRTAESTLHADLAAIRRQQVLTLASAAGAATFVLVLLIPGGRTREPAGYSLLAGTRWTEPAEEATGGAASGPASFPPRPAGDSRAPSGQPAAPEPVRLDFGAAAELCTDFGRTASTTELPGLLERAASLLGAHGLILWIAEPGGNALHPSLACGYPAHTLDRLGTIASDADNAAAASYRSADVRTVSGRDGAPGALVVPLLSAAGCLGVLTAEIPDGGEADPSVVAGTKLLAAQIAALVGSAPVTPLAAHEPLARAESG